MTAAAPSVARIDRADRGCASFATTRSPYFYAWLAVGRVPLDAAAVGLAAARPCSTRVDRRASRVAVGCARRPRRGSRSPAGRCSSAQPCSGTARSSDGSPCRASTSCRSLATGPGPDGPPAAGLAGRGGQPVPRRRPGPRARPRRLARHLRRGALGGHRARGHVRDLAVGHPRCGRAGHRRARHLSRPRSAAAHVAARRARGDRRRHRLRRRLVRRGRSRSRPPARKALCGAGSPRSTPGALAAALPRPGRLASSCSRCPARPASSASASRCCSSPRRCSPATSVSATSGCSRRTCSCSPVAPAVGGPARRVPPPGRRVGRPAGRAAHRPDPEAVVAHVTARTFAHGPPPMPAPTSVRGALRRARRRRSRRAARRDGADASPTRPARPRRASSSRHRAGRRRASRRCCARCSG